MPLWSRLKSLAHNVLRKPAIESELDEELQTYTAQLTDEKIAAGMPAAEARRTTLADLGGLEQIKQSVRDRRTGAILELLWQDARYALRQLVRNRAFTFTAVITLGLGIGATTAIFSAVYALLLRPLPYPDASRLMVIGPQDPGINMNALISQDFVAARSSLKCFQQIAGYIDWPQNLTGAGDALRVTRVSVTANFLPMLGAVPQLGRLFTTEEDRFGGPPVMMLSDHLWRTKFHADPSVIGKKVSIDGNSQTIIGVLPARFRFPDLTLEPDVYTAADLENDSRFAADKIMYAVSTIALLRPNVSMLQAQAEAQTFFTTRHRTAPPGFGSYFAGLNIFVEPLQRSITGNNRRPLLILLACVLTVLLIACANVANLQLARAVSRRHETALRGTLGASRLRLIRQFIVESLVLSSLAAGLGLVFALIITSLVRHTGTLDTSHPASRVAQLLQLPFGKLSASIYVDAWVLVFTIGLALVTTFLFGLAPAISGSRLDLRSALQSAAMRVTQGREQRLLRHSLLIFEVALAVVLLASAGLLVRSFINVMRYESGFDPSNTLSASTFLNGPEYQHDNKRVAQFIVNLLPHLQALPGVQSAAIASTMPLQEAGTEPISFGSPANLPSVEKTPVITIVSITPDYFRVIGNPILQGRAFSVNDTAASQQVVIVNQAFAKRFFGGSALGKQFNRISWGRHDATVMTIVGIAEDLRHNGIDRPVEPEFYVPEGQCPISDLHIALRSTADPALLANAMRKAVLAVDPQQPLFDIQTMDQRVSSQVAQRRLIMLLIATFALLAVILSAVGVYGVFAYSVSQRTQEMGIRLALGASRRGLIGLIVSQAGRLIAAGGILGIAGAFLLSRLLTSMLVGVKPHDAISFSLAWILMTAVALLASTIPASAAARTDLVSVLHTE
jgi:putative ABC transport system permease protein